MAVETSKYRTYFKVKLPDLIKSSGSRTIQLFKLAQKYWNWCVIWMTHTCLLFHQYFSLFRKIIHRHLLAVCYWSMKWMQHTFWKLCKRFFPHECWKCPLFIHCRTSLTLGKCRFVRHAHPIIIRIRFLPPVSLSAFEYIMVFCTREFTLFSYFTICIENNFKNTKINNQFIDLIFLN